MKKKLKIIDEIIKRHPSCGVNLDWSWYIGGMRDTGDWNKNIMLEAPTKDLEDFLAKLIADENKPPIEYTEE